MKNQDIIASYRRLLTEAWICSAALETKLNELLILAKELDNKVSVVTADGVVSSAQTAAAVMRVHKELSSAEQVTATLDKAKGYLDKAFKLKQLEEDLYGSHE